MKKRIITGLILSAITGVLIYFAGVYFAVVALICICFALYSVGDSVDIKHSHVISTRNVEQDGLGS